MSKLLFSVMAMACSFSLAAMQQPAKQDPCKRWHDFVKAAAAAKHLDKTALEEVTRQVTKAGCNSTSDREVPKAHLAYYESAGAKVGCPWFGWPPRESDRCTVLKTFKPEESKE